MRLGIFAKTFPGSDAAQVLGSVRRAGYECAQFNLACAGLAAMPEEVPDAVRVAIGNAATSTGVELVALSGTYNMIHPNASVRADGLRRLKVVLDGARALGIGLVTLCTGTRDADDQWRAHPDNSSPAAWADLSREMERAVAMAEAAGVDLGIEPEQANVVSSAAHARRLIDELRSRRIRVVLDPANLFEVADRAQAREIVAAAIDLVGDRIAMAHAKDRRADGEFVAAGEGVVDFADFVSRLRRAGFAGALVTHGLSAEQAPGVAAFLSGIIAA
jgi:sugar phosphate isomerase/epimerase